MDRILQTANRLQNPLSYLFINNENDISYAKEFTIKDLSVLVSYVDNEKMNDNLFNVLFEILKENMQSLYSQSSWGWKEEEKKKEMKEKETKILIVKEKNTEKIIAFSHFRFVLERGIRSVYCYEIQIIPSFRSFGLGSLLMNILEWMGYKSKIKYSLLTCFTFNPAFNFYQKIGYKTEEEYDFEEDSDDEEVECNEEDNENDDNNNEEEDDDHSDIKLLIKRTSKLSQ